MVTMKIIFCLMISAQALSIFGLSSSDTGSSIYPQNLLTVSEAEKILGEPALLKDSSTTIKDDVITYSCSYTALSSDKKTGKTGNLYFMVEEYKQMASAKEIYASIKKSNEDHEGIKIINDMGDEAYFHSSENFLFIIVRKGTKMLRMKVNRVTNNTSLDEFMLASKNIIAVL